MNLNIPFTGMCDACCRRFFVSEAFYNTVELTWKLLESPQQVLPEHLLFAARIFLLSQVLGDGPSENEPVYAEEGNAKVHGAAATVDQRGYVV